MDQYDFVLFDLDGLLVNTEMLHYQAYKEMLRRRGYTLPWTLHHYYAAAHLGDGKIAPHLYQILPALEKEDWAVLYGEKRAILTALLRQGALDLMPGVEAVLKALSIKDMQRCVVTNSRREDVDLIRACLPVLETIPHWLTRENYTQAKPHPEGYQKAIERFAKPGSRVIGFEDTYRGLSALLGAQVHQPVLICAHDHPQMQSPRPKGVRHFTSLQIVDLH